MSNHQNMASTSKKNLYCREKYVDILDQVYGRSVFRSKPGAQLRKCCYGEACRGAHSEEEITYLPANYNFNKLDKSKIDYISLYNNICFEMERSQKLVLHPELKIRIDNYSNLNFIELLNLWYDLSCYHRKVKKELNDGKDNEYYTIGNNIPQFFLEQEDISWPLERLTKSCPKFKKLISKIESGGEKPIIWDICCGSINCKEGCHQDANLICHKDFLTGDCECLTLEELDSKKQELTDQISEIKDILSGNSGFQISSKKKKSIQNKVYKLQKEYNGLFRKVHFTDDGMIPFEIQLASYLEEKERKKSQQTKEIQSRSTLIKTGAAKKKIVKPVF